jgi:Tfp pilus assembly protein PilF
MEGRGIMQSWSNSEKKALVATVLFVLAVLPFIQSINFGAINFDDFPYTLNNPHVTRGISLDGLRYAFFGTRELGIWFPLTLLSYQMDVTIAGASAQTFHISSVIWHGLATVALFFLIHAILTARFGGQATWHSLAISAVVALWWGVHPQRVESVVWIASRKDLVSGLFAFLALNAYLHTRLNRSQENASASFSAERGDFITWGLYLLAIMGKPSVMTLPLAMGCAEWLAIGRVSWRKLVVPCVMSVCCACLAVFMQTDADTFAPGAERVAFWDRAVTSMASIFYYLKTLVAPGALSIFYPWPRQLEYGQALLGLGIVGAWLFVGFVFLKHIGARKGSAWGDLAVTGLWYFGTLAPMLSLFMFGMHARADRFAYLPSVAVAVGAAIWLMSRQRGTLTTCVALAVCFPYGLKAYNEAKHWASSVSVFERAVAATKENAKAYSMLAGAYMMEQHRIPEARDALRNSIAIRPNSENIGLLSFLLCTHASSAELEESVALARQALALNADEKTALATLGANALRKEDWKEAEEFLRMSLEGQNEIQPVIWEWFGLAMFNQKEYKEAHEAFEKAASVPGFMTPALQERIALAYQKWQQQLKAEKE